MIQPVPTPLKIIIYVLFILFVFFQVAYVKAYDTAQDLLSNYTLIKKHSNPSDFNNNIIFISSGKPIYRNYFDSYFNINFYTIYIKKIIRRCVVKERRRDDGQREETHDWVQYNGYSTHQDPLYSTYEKTMDFKIGNYNVLSNSFNNIETNDYIPSENEVLNFSKSKASSNLIYYGDGYFFDINFPDHRSLYIRLHDCRDQDTYIKFEVYNPKKVSVFGLLNNGNIRHVNFLKYDFSVIYDGKISPNQFVVNSILKERTKTIITGVISIVLIIIMFIYFYRALFSIAALSFLIIISILIRAFYISNFPIKFKYVLFYSILGVLVTILYYDPKLTKFISIILIS